MFFVLFIKMNYKETTIDMYDYYAPGFNENTWRDLETLRWYMGDFLFKLKGFRVLDLGCGPGKCSEVIKKEGYVVTSFDLSKQMLKLCERRNSRRVLGDLESMPFLDRKFDGILASTSLIHMPKSNLPNVLRDIKRCLRKNGVFYPIVKEGEGEGWEESDKYPGMERYIAYYKKEEFREYLEDSGFDITKTITEKVGRATFLTYKCNF